MKIAIFHNFMDNIGGAEIVALTLAKELKADLYTTNIDKVKIAKMGYGDLLDNIKTIGVIPKKAPFRQQLALYKFRHLNLSGKYDFFIIAGDWAMSGAVNNHPNAWYVHSPLNELWEFKDFIKDNLLSPWKKPLFEQFVSYNRKKTTRYARFVDNWVCNSTNTEKRIEKYYSQDAEIIRPPIDTTRHYYGEDKKYWLSVNRLATHKRIEMQIEAFRDLPQKKLIIVGSYEKGVTQFEEYKALIEKIKPNNVEIKHWVSERDLLDLYANCTGFLTTSQNEDFGMNVVEAMASGKAVIAPNEGGYKESVIDQETGYLINDINSEKIKDKILKIENLLTDNPLHFKDASQAQAKNFDKDVFIKGFKKMMFRTQDE